MSKELKIKSNGLRNELKEIRKSIDTLTHALHILVELQTHNRYEKSTIYHSDSAPDGMRWVTTVSKDQESTDGTLRDND